MSNFLNAFWTSLVVLWTDLNFDTTSKDVGSIILLNSSRSISPFWSTSPITKIAFISSSLSLWPLLLTADWNFIENYFLFKKFRNEKYLQFSEWYRPISVEVPGLERFLHVLQGIKISFHLDTNSHHSRSSIYIILLFPNKKERKKGKVVMFLSWDTISAAFGNMSWTNSPISISPSPLISAISNAVLASSNVNCCQKYYGNPSVLTKKNSRAHLGTCSL